MGFEGYDKLNLRIKNYYSQQIHLIVVVFKQFLAGDAEEKKEDFATVESTDEKEKKKKWK